MKIQAKRVQDSILEEDQTNHVVFQDDFGEEIVNIVPPRDSYTRSNSTAYPQNVMFREDKKRPMTK